MADPTTVTHPAIRIIGIVARTRNADEMAGANRIGELWRRFTSGEGGRITDVAEPEVIYSVYSKYESDANGLYDVLVGKSVRPEAAVPSGMQSVDAPAGKYMIFPARDAHPQSIIAAWGEVYAFFAQPGAPKRAYGADFERHTQQGSELFLGILGVL